MQFNSCRLADFHEDTRTLSTVAYDHCRRFLNEWRNGYDEVTARSDASLDGHTVRRKIVENGANHIIYYVADVFAQTLRSL